MVGLGEGLASPWRSKGRGWGGQKRANGIRERARRNKKALPNEDSEGRKENGKQPEIGSV